MTAKSAFSEAADKILRMKMHREESQVTTSLKKQRNLTPQFKHGLPEVSIL